jgi:chemotaxis receptor (MCP) glutamine deamidase CheD
MGQADKATEKLQNAAQYSLETTQYYNEASKYYNAENLYKELASLHKQQNTISVYQEKLQNDLTTSRRSNDQPLELETRLALGAVYRVQNNQDAAVQHYSTAYSLQQGKVDYEAHRVEQREVGFSNREKIGTDNIQQCVAVIIYDPESKETALAHVDRFTDPKSLSDEVIDKFPLPAAGKKLQVYLVGGRDRSPGSIAVSDGNIRKVMEVLKTYPHIDIKSADIGNKEIPSGVVFDPLTGKLEHAIPGKESETAALRQARLNLMTPGDNSSSLHQNSKFLI